MTQRTGGQGRGVGGMSGRAAAWLAWSLVVLSVVLLVGGLSFALMTRSSVPERPYDGLVTLSVLALAFSVIGAIIASRQPRNAIGWIFCSVGVTIGFSSFAGYTLEAGPLEDFPRIMNPYGVDSPILDAIAVAGAILASASMVASAISLIVRMRRAGRAQRQQIKWLAYGGALAVGAVFVGGVISVWIGEVGYALTSIGLLGVPIFTGVAIARYRLYEIDIVINRTLVYGALTAALVGVYFGGVATLQALFRALSGQQSTLAVVASTLLIAALFN